MVRKPQIRPVSVTHNLVSTFWSADVQALEKEIRKFAVLAGSAGPCHVAMFEMAGDPCLHVNVTHRRLTKPVRGWAGPGASPNGFVHNRMFDALPIAGILRHIRQAVFAPSAAVAS